LQYPFKKLRNYQKNFPKVQRKKCSYHKMLGCYRVKLYTFRKN